MSSFKNLEMAAAVSNHPNITIRKSFFGLCRNAVYTPTQSKIQVALYDYSSENGDQLKLLLRLSGDDLKSFIRQTGLIEQAAAGPYRLEMCFSADHQFAALLLTGYSDFQYKPLADVRFYEGEEAEMIIRLLKKN